MHRDDLLLWVRVRARLHGPREAGRAIRAVVSALAAYAPPTMIGELRTQLPTPLREPLAVTGAGLVARVASALQLDEPDATFLTRVVCEELNRYCHGMTPSRLASSLPPSQRPLAEACGADATHRVVRLLPALSSAAPSLIGPMGTTVRKVATPVRRTTA